MAALSVFWFDGTRDGTGYPGGASRVTTGCDLCGSEGGARVWADDDCRVVLIDDPRFPGYCRVIWHGHVAEMTDLAPGERTHLMNVTFAVESALRALVQPDKVNLASLGNMTPHLHWHVIPRWRDDSHYPQPIWAAAVRTAAPRPAAISQSALQTGIQRFLNSARPKKG